MASANLRNNWLGGMTPATMVAALRRMSGQLAVMMPSRILPPIRPFNSFGMLAGSKT